MNTDKPSDPKTQPLNFANPAPAQAPSTTASSQQSTNSTPATNFQFAAPATQFQFPTTPTTAAQTKPPTTGTGFNLPPSTQTGAMPPLSFNLPASTKPATPTTNTLSALKPTTAGTTPVSTVTTSSTATSLSLPTSISTTTPSLGTAAKTTAPNAPAQPQTLTFQQLEELILNKWTAELYEQEKVFFNQATQINIWDKVINENAEKLTQLHSTMEKVRKQQTKINDDLEVIATHQKDLEACLIPLEKEDLLSVMKGDPNRKNLYSNAKKIDSQIKSMSENLKETIEHINETSRSHDTEDPVIQVGRILNAHMESLRWIDEHTARMQDYFDSLLKTHDDLRRECDLSKH